MTEPLKPSKEQILQATEDTVNAYGDREVVNDEVFGFARNTRAELLAAQEQIASLAYQLRDMTEDRNLWRDAHDDDCPNKDIVDAQAERVRMLEEALRTIRPFVAQCFTTLRFIRSKDEEDNLQAAHDALATIDAALNTQPTCPLYVAPAAASGVTKHREEKAQS